MPGLDSNLVKINVVPVSIRFAMSFGGPFVHNIDPVIGTIFGVHLWWYGLSYTLGFVNAFMFVRRRRHILGLSMVPVYDLSLLLAGGVLIGGRFVEVVFYEWPFYSEHYT